MKISLRISGLIIMLSGMIFLVSALIGKSLFSFLAGVACIICGLFWIWPHKIKFNTHSGEKPRAKRSNRGSGRYSR